MSNRRPTVFARVEPAVRERIRDEAARSFDGNESMLVRRAVVQYLDDLDKQRRRESAMAPLIEAIEREAAVA